MVKKEKGQTMLNPSQIRLLQRAVTAADKHDRASIYIKGAGDCEAARALERKGFGRVMPGYLQTFSISDKGRAALLD